MKIAISSGHGSKVPGAIGPSPWGLDEHKEAVRVVDKMAEFIRATGNGVETYEDTVSKTQNENLNRLVDWHNSRTRDYDVSVHFNCYESTTKPMGTECLYITQSSLASKVAAGIGDAGDFINRGAKKRTDLFFLNNTAKPAILIEVCFVDSQPDCGLYKQNFDDICRAAAEAITGAAIQPGPPPITAKPQLSKGDKDVPPGNYVTELQRDLNADNNADLVPDGDFGSLTDEAVRTYQASRGLDSDGIVGEQTWSALDSHAPPYVPPGLPPVLSAQHQRDIADIAIASSIASYSWRDRGRAPSGYIKGFALAWANAYRQLLLKYPPALEMARAKSSSSKDVLNVYASDFNSRGMANGTSGPDTMRHLWALMLGLGMRESSGKHCEGRDQSASNTTSDTCEAGLFQTSYNAHSCSDTFDQLFNAFQAAQSTDNPQGFLSYFRENVSCSSSSWDNYGSGNGELFQKMCKNQPAFACETCAVTLRNLCDHYGPINRHEAELRTDADTMLKEVQDYVDEIGGGEA